MVLCLDENIEFQFDLSGKGSRVTMDLLTNLFLNTIDHSIKYYKVTREHIFAWDENQLKTAITPAISQLTPIFLVEHPLQRKPRGEEPYEGRVDYWVNYRSYSYLIELKHSYFGYSNQKPNDKMKNRFNNAIMQLNNIRKKQSRIFTKGKGLFKIALEAVVFYTRSPSINDKTYDYKELFKQIIKDPAFSKVNFSALWIINKQQRKVEYANLTEYYPAFGLIGNIKSL